MSDELILAELRALRQEVAELRDAVESRSSGLPDLIGKPKVTMLRVFRAAEDLSQQDLAREAGVDAVTIHRLEKGGKPSTKTANAVAQALGRPVGSIFPEVTNGEIEPEPAVN